MTHTLGAVLGVLGSSWDILLDSGVYVIFGLLVAGLVNAFVSSAVIAERLGSRSIRSVFLASLLGVPLPLCSCGVVPTAVSLFDKGASKGATVSFLVSTPETGVDSIAVSYALLDPIMTVWRPVAAFVSGMFAGIAENLVGEKRPLPRRAESCGCAVCGEAEGLSPHEHAIGDRIAGGVRYAFVVLLGDISRWFLLGVLIAGAIAYFVPEGIIGEKVGYGFPAMLVMALAGMPLYMCATSSTPIASALIAKGVSPGAALVFLLTGPATNAASLTMVARFLGAKSTAVYLLSILASSLLLGAVLNMIYIHTGLDARATVGKASEVIPMWLKTSGAALLLALMANSVIQERRRRSCGASQRREDKDGCDCKG